MTNECLRSNWNISRHASSHLRRLPKGIFAILLLGRRLYSERAYIVEYAMSQFGTVIRKWSIVVAAGILFLQVSSLSGQSQSLNMAQSPNTSAAPSFSKDDAIQQTIHDYILAHPEVIIEFAAVGEIETTRTFRSDHKVEDCILKEGPSWGC